MMMMNLAAEDYLTNDYLDNVIDFIPSMKNLKFKDIPSFIRTTNPDDIMLKFALRETERSKRASAIILNTFDDHPVHELHFTSGLSSWTASSLS